MNRVVLAVIVALAATAAVLGLAAGWRYVTLDEGRVIERYAQLYRDETGGALIDCVAQPGQGDIWLVIRCNGVETRTFHVGHRGQLLASPPPGI